MSTKQKIILSYFREGKSQRQIARELHITRKTVRRYVESYNTSKLAQESSSEAKVLSRAIVEAPRYDTSNRGKRKLTKGISSKIDSFLEANTRKRQAGLHKQVMKKIDIHEALLAEGFKIGYTTVCNYIRDKTGASQKEAFIRQKYDPGRVCEFDWGEVKLWIKGKLQRFYLAIFTSAYSNYRYAELYERQDTMSFQQAHVNFFTHKGGVYGQLVYDNMRVAVRRFVGLSEKEPTEALLQLSSYYQFDYRFCNAGKGNEKGHVERSVEFIRRKAFCKQDNFNSLKEANNWLQSRCKQLNKNHDNQSLMAAEDSYLHHLPTTPFDCCSLEECRADKYSTIIIGANRYSVPDHLVGKMITVKVYAHSIECFYEKKLIATHSRAIIKHDWVIKLEHYLSTLYIKPGALHSSLALERSHECIRNLYTEHFRESPRDFIELLTYIQQKDVSINSLQQAITELEKMGCRQITADKIITVCSRKKTVWQPMENDEITQHSEKQLLQLTKLFNHQTLN